MTGKFWKRITKRSPDWDWWTESIYWFVNHPATKRGEANVKETREMARQRDKVKARLSPEDFNKWQAAVCEGIRRMREGKPPLPAEELVKICEEKERKRLEQIDRSKKESDDPKDMTDKELIGAYACISEAMDGLSPQLYGGSQSFEQYYLDCLEAEIERRNIDRIQVLVSSEPEDMTDKELLEYFFAILKIEEPDPESEYWEEYWGKIINEIKRRGLWEKAQSMEEV